MTRTDTTDFHHYHPLVSWRSVLAGLAVTLLTMACLIALGMAMGGVGLEDGASLATAGLFAGVWFVASTIIALAAGSYFAARVSKFQTARIGSAHGLIISALFFITIMWSTFSTVGWAGRMSGQAVGGAASAVASGANQAAQNPFVANIVEDAVADLNIPTERIQGVVTGVATRLLRGNTESAQTYLARQTGTSTEEAQERMLQLRAQVDQFIVESREKAAEALSAAGWTLFLMITIGSIAAMGGGALASRTNLRKPLEHDHHFGASEFKTATVYT